MTPPPYDPRQAVRVCCGDTHWGPEPIDYPCPEALCPHGFYREACGDCQDEAAGGAS